MIWAADKNYLSAAEWLVEKNADINKANKVSAAGATAAVESTAVSVDTSLIMFALSLVTERVDSDALRCL